MFSTGQGLQELQEMDGSWAVSFDCFHQIRGIQLRIVINWNSYTIENSFHLIGNDLEVGASYLRAYSFEISNAVHKILVQ